MINKLVIDNKKKDTYKPLLKIKTDNEEYIIYTKDEQNKLGDTVCYVSSYNFSDGVQRLEKIESDETIEWLDNIFMQVQNLMNKKESSD